MGDTPFDHDLSLPFPIEFLIRDTPRSHQSSNAKAKELWKRNIGEHARTHIETLGDLFYLDHRPLAMTIYYFSPLPMQGDVDNIVKLILDGLTTIVYPDDRLLERIVVQKFEPDTDFDFASPSLTLRQAVEMAPPVVYIRLEDDLGWRLVP